MSVAGPHYTHDFAGMHIDAAANVLGKTRDGARNWLADRGYRMASDRRLWRSRPAQEIADEVNARIQSMRPQSNCFLCGERGECKHR